MKIEDNRFVVTGGTLAEEGVSDPAASRASTSTHMDFGRAKAERLLDWTPQVDLAEGIRRLAEWRACREAR